MNPRAVKAVLAELVDRRLLNDVDSDLHAEIGEAVARAALGERNVQTASDDWDESDLAELRRMVPDINAVLTHNPVHQVYFRAGLLACREYMARFVEQGGDTVTAASIRANWWPSLGDDPGIPRQLAFAEVAIERESGRIDHADTPPNIEALARAYVFLAATIPGSDLPSPNRSNRRPRP